MAFISQRNTGSVWDKRARYIDQSTSALQRYVALGDEYARKTRMKMYTPEQAQDADTSLYERLLKDEQKVKPGRMPERSSGVANTSLSTGWGARHLATSGVSHQPFIQTAHHAGAISTDETISLNEEDMQMHTEHITKVETGYIKNIMDDGILDDTEEDNDDEKFKSQAMLVENVWEQLPNQSARMYPKPLNMANYSHTTSNQQFVPKSDVPKSPYGILYDIAQGVKEKYPPGSFGEETNVPGELKMINVHKFMHNRKQATKKKIFQEWKHEMWSEKLGRAANKNPPKPTMDLRRSKRENKGKAAITYSPEMFKKKERKRLRK